MTVTTPVVVDTDVISFLFKSHSLAPAYQNLLAGRPLAVSLISLAEIEYGMEIKSWGVARRNLMHRFLARFTLLRPDAETAVFVGSDQKRVREKRPSDHVCRCLDRGSSRATECSTGDP